MLQNPPPRRSYCHDVFYEVNIRQYTKEGTIAAFSNHLPRLAEMGVTILWLMPHYPVGNRNRKGSAGSYYSIRDHRAVNPDFGTMDEFKSLVQRAHALDMKVIIDWVANHAAWDHVWTKSNPAFFQQDENGSFLSPYDWSDVIQIDHQNPNAHQALWEDMAFWIKETDVDGFRADMAHLTPLSFWLEARRKMECIKSDLIWLAETEDPTYYKAFDLVYAWKWMHKMEAFVKEHLPIHAFFDVLDDQEKPNSQEARQLYFTSNHDENSWNGTEFEKYGQYAEALSVFAFLYPKAVPLIYTGQEIPNRKRLAFFEEDPLDWPSDLKLDVFYKKLSLLRQRINEETQFNFVDPVGRMIGFRLGEGVGEIIVWLNLDTIPQTPENHTDGTNSYIDWMLGTVETCINQCKTLGPGEYLIWVRTNSNS
jgi:alpha-amylase